MKSPKQTRQPFEGLAVFVGTPDQFVTLARLGNAPIRRDAKHRDLAHSDSQHHPNSTGT